MQRKMGNTKNRKYHGINLFSVVLKFFKKSFEGIQHKAEWNISCKAQVILH